MQLYKQLRSDIINGTYKHGSKLPSKRTVAEETDISTITVEHSYALLCDEGYIESRQRSGYYVVFSPSDGFAYTMKHSTIQVLPHHKSNDYEFPFSVLTKTMRKVMSDYGESILEKSPNIGCEQLRIAIAGYLAASRAIHTNYKNIVIGSGSEYLYGLIAQLLGKDKIYAIESPSYNKIEQTYSAFNIKYRMLPLGINGIKSSALNNTDADILHITPYRSFPSGVTASASKKHEYLRWSDHGGRYIIEDDFESEFSVSKKSEETLFSLSKNKNVIYMNTFSKTLSPSLRVGYMVLPDGLADRFQQKLGFYSCTVPTFEQLVLACLISNGDFERHINRVRRKKRREIKQG